MFDELVKCLEEQYLNFLCSLRNANKEEDKKVKRMSRSRKRRSSTDMMRCDPRQS